MDKAVSIIKDIIDKESLDYLSREPYDVYQALLKMKVDPSLARLVLLTLLSGTAKKAGKLDFAELSKDIQAECFLKKTVADKLATMYKALFDKDNVSSWNKKKNSGFKEFCEKVWNFSWNKSKEWHNGCGYVVCTCQVDVDVRVEKSEVLKRALGVTLRNNVFMSADNIADILQDELDTFLDPDMESYVMADDYYEPWMPDYDCEDALKKYCEKYGLVLLSYNCDGDTSDWET